MRFLFALFYLPFILTGCNFAENSISREKIGAFNKTNDSSITYAQSQQPENKQPASARLIQKVDFGNFTYRWCNNKDSIGDKIKLKNSSLETKRKLVGGEEERVIFSLENVYYQDLTLDGNDEALVTVTSVIDHNTADTCTYLFTINNDAPKLLWSHNNGDDKDRGLRRIYLDEDVLIFEEYVHRSTEEEIMRTPPDTINRLKYKWNGSEIVLLSSEYFPNEQRNTSFLGYPKNKFP